MQCYYFIYLLCILYGSIDNRQCIIYCCCLVLVYSVNCACVMEIDNSVDVSLSASVHVVSDLVCCFLFFKFFSVVVCVLYASTQQTRPTISTVATMHVYNCVRMESYQLDLKRPRFFVVRMVRIGFIDINNAHLHVASANVDAPMWAFTTAFMCIACLLLSLVCVGSVCFALCCSIVILH